MESMMGKFDFNFGYTDPKESPFWDDSYEEIVKSYPLEEQARVRDDLMNARNSDKYGVRIGIVGGVMCDDFSRFVKHGKCQSDGNA